MHCLPGKFLSAGKSIFSGRKFDFPSEGKNQGKARTPDFLK